MSKSNSCIYILARFPVFNTPEVPEFLSFDKLHSELLYSSLVLNYLEILEPAAENYSFYFCLDEKDKEHVPAEFNSDFILWYDSKNKNSLFRLLTEKYFTRFANNILISAESIGITDKDFKKTMNLLAIEDDAIVISKSSGGKTCLVGFNRLDENFFNDFSWDELNYDKALAAACRQNAHVHILENFLVVENSEEYKQLYQELSKKESLAYCSQKMHERFTTVFIEYKDLLK